MSLDTAKVSDLRNQTLAVFEKRITPGAVLFRFLIKGQYIVYAPPSSFMVLPVINFIICITSWMLHVLSNSRVYVWFLNSGAT